MYVSFLLYLFLQKISPKMKIRTDIDRYGLHVLLLFDTEWWEFLFVHLVDDHGSQSHGCQTDRDDGRCHFFHILTS